MEEHEPGTEALPDLHCVTIMWSHSDEMPPQVDLGDTSPWLAFSLLQTVLDGLRMTLAPPAINFNGTTIFEVVEGYDE